MSFEKNTPLTLQEAIQLATDMLANNWFVMPESERVRLETPSAPKLPCGLKGCRCEDIDFAKNFIVEQEFKIPTHLATLVVYHWKPFKQDTNIKYPFLYKWN